MSRPHSASAPLSILAVIALLVASACTAAPASPTPAGGDGGAEATEEGNGGAEATEDGDDDGGEGGEGAGEVCDIISEAEIEGITETDVTETVTTSNSCNWTIGEFSVIDVRDEGTFDDSLEVHRQICEDEEDVSGVGEEAIWCEGITLLYFNDGGRTMAVQLVLFEGELERDPLEVATDIAQLVVDRL